MIWLFFIGYLILCILHFKWVKTYKTDIMKWYDYLNLLNILIWIDMMATIHILRQKIILKEKILEKKQ
jgi:hypothetical protein